MNSIKCPECGLVNFASATECKRCHWKFHQAESEDALPGGSDDAVAEAHSEPSIGEKDQKEFSAPLPEYFDEKLERFNLPVILFAITVLLTVVILGYQLQQYLVLTGSPEWKAIIDPSNKFHTSSLEPLLYLEWLLKVLALMASIALLVPLFRKSGSFIKWVRVYLLGSFLYSAFEIAAGLSLRASMSELPLGKAGGPIMDQLFWGSFLCVISILVAFIWYRYFTTSDRVQRIFVN